MTGTLESSRIRSTCRVTPVFRRIELSWVLNVVIWTSKSMVTSANFLPAKSATASRLSAGDNPKNSAKSLSEGEHSVRVGKNDHCQRPSVNCQVGAERRYCQDVGQATMMPSDTHACDRCGGFLLHSRCGDSCFEPARSRRHPAHQVFGSGSSTHCLAATRARRPGLSGSPARRCRRRSPQRGAGRAPAGPQRIPYQGCASSTCSRATCRAA